VACLTVGCFYHHLCVLLLPLAGAELALATFRCWRRDGALDARTLAPFALGAVLILLPVGQTLLVMSEVDRGNREFRQAVHDRSWEQFTRNSEGPAVLAYPFRDGIFKGVAEVRAPRKSRSPAYLTIPSSWYWKLVPAPLGQLYLTVLFGLALLLRGWQRKTGRFEIATAYFYLLPFLALVSREFLAARALVFFGLVFSVGSAYVLAAGLARVPVPGRVALAALLLIPLWSHALVVADHIGHRADLKRWDYRSKKRMIDYFAANTTCDDVLAAEGPLSMAIAAGSGIRAPFAYADRLFGRVTHLEDDLGILLGLQTSHRSFFEAARRSGVTYIVASGKVREKLHRWTKHGLELAIRTGDTAAFRVLAPPRPVAAQQAPEASGSPPAPGGLSSAATDRAGQPR
jgi:hypothetical protein